MASPPTGYQVQYKKTTDSTYTSFPSTTSSVQQVITGLAASTAYNFRVYAFNSAGNGSPSSPDVNASTIAAVALRKWYENPGQRGSFWVKPFQSSSKWITSGAIITALRGGTPSVNVTGNFSPPTYIGVASDPIVTVKDGTRTDTYHMPLGAIPEGPSSSVDQSMGWVDVTQPYKVMSISGASINTGSVQSSGSVITGTYGYSISDGAGILMVDAVTGQPGDNNSIGCIQSLELSKISADPNYVIQHMMTFQTDVSFQASSAGPIWPLKITDTSSGGVANPYQGPIPQGITIGIPASTPRPTGKTRGFYALWDVFQQFGGFNYNFGQVGGTNIEVCDASGLYTSLVNDIVASWPAVMASMCILDWTNGVSGAQYSLATTKGAIAGSTDAFPSPPPLDLSPTGGANVSFTWYPSGYTATPTN